MKEKHADFIALTSRKRPEAITGDNYASFEAYVCANGWDTTIAGAQNPFLRRKYMVLVHLFHKQIQCACATDKQALKKQVAVLQKLTTRCDVPKASALTIILAHWNAWRINWTHRHNLYASLEGKTPAMWIFLTRHFSGCNIILGNGLDKRVPWHSFAVPFNLQINSLKTTAAF